MLLQPQIQRRSHPHRNTCARIVAAGAALGLASAAIAGGHKAIVGFDDLAARIGAEHMPTGATVRVAQVEALVNNSYRPNAGHAQFAGKQFQWMSGGSTGSSNHATNVGLRFYGAVDGLVPGIPLIHSYEVNSFATNQWLRANFNAATPPLAPPGQTKIVNHSWVGDGGGLNASVLRRSDFVMDNHNVLMVVGMNNGSPNAPLLSHVYNGISVGRTTGQHATGPTFPGLDGPGRMKPEIVAPGNNTSLATPVVSSAAAMMVDIARTTPGLSGLPAAERSDVIKAVLMAGARHEASWSNNPATDGANRGRTAQPLDSVFGSGTVNVDRSHRILTGGSHVGSDAVPDAAVTPAGWNRAVMAAGQHSRYWRFSVSEKADEVSILATWNRRVTASNMDSWSIAHFELKLWRVSGGELVSLIGDAGIGVFDAGNVVSESAVDNVQHLYLRGLEAGDYVLELRRVDSLGQAWAVAVAWLLPVADQIPGDLNGDGVVDVSDLLLLFAAWGECPQGSCAADLNGDGFVDVSDLLLLLANWG